VILLISAYSSILEGCLQDGLFELCGVSSVEGNCCPIISPVVEIGGTEVDHGFLPSASLLKSKYQTHYREDLSSLHTSRSLGSTIMDNVRLTMELSISPPSITWRYLTYQLVNTMTRITPDNPISFRLNNLLNLISDITIWNSRFTDCDTFLD
jgi:hypothetical protein